MDNKNKLIEFNTTPFAKGLNVTYGKIPVKLEFCFFFCEATGLLKLSLYTGLDKVYRINNIGQFLESLIEQRRYHFGKSFIFEPDRMSFDKTGRNILDFLTNLKNRRKCNTQEPDRELQGSEVVLCEDELEKLLDCIWEDRNRISFHKQSEKLHFSEDAGMKISVGKEKDSILLVMDYSEYGDFEPVTINFRYIVFRDKKIIAKLPENNRAIFSGIYDYKNRENIVRFKVGEDEKKLFKKNFYDRYGSGLEISIDKSVLEDLSAGSLVSKVYFDIASKGIVSKIEYCYDGKIINPLDDNNQYKSIREYEDEKKVLFELKNYGFKEHGKLFLLEDVEKIISLLTDKLLILKKISQVYYSEDFKKLHVKNISSLGLSLSDDGSVIHMNINLENVSDEELIELLNSIKNGKKYYRLKDGSIINLASLESSKFADLINGLHINANSISEGVFEVPSNKCIYIDNYLKENGLENVNMDSRLQSLISSISKPQDREIELNAHLKGVIRNYQITGVKWLKSIASYSFGGILADDMGLGKTLQVLAFMSSEKNRILPAIVIAPTSVVFNWKMEAEKFTPELKVRAISGTKEKRTLQILALKDCDLAVTSYGALKNDIEDYKRIKFSYVFLDEAQNIKNPLTLNANSVKELNANCRFALTGTPIENRLTEIWSIFDFIMPGYLLDKNKFSSLYEEPVINGKNTDKMKELSDLIRPFILRRLKKDVLHELPDKIETDYYNDMTKEQKKLYMAYYKQVKNELQAKIDESGIDKNRIEILTALTRLRQICAHPGTFLDDYRGGSCKLDLAVELITESINSGHSILLFSQFTKMLKIIRSELIKNGTNHYYLDGAMPPHERVMEIDNFNNDREAVFLISLKAGGTGLNLSKADIVIHFDPWWNPAVEDQASDRAHRMGQKNAVQVYKLLTMGTIEEKISHLQEKKRHLIESIIKPGENFINTLTEADIRDLFGF